MRGEGATVPFLFKGMIDKEVVTRLAEEQLAFSDCYLVDVAIKPNNLIVVEIDHDVAVGIDDCVVLNQYIVAHLDKDVEDYELEVGSSGVGFPFKIIRQYIKNMGNEVEVLLKSGMKLKGVLKSADETSITISRGNRRSREIEETGEQTNSKKKKKKETVLENQTYKYDEIKHTKNIIRFK